MLSRLCLSPSCHTPIFDLRCHWHVSFDSTFIRLAERYFKIPHYSSESGPLLSVFLFFYHIFHFHLLFKLLINFNFFYKNLYFPFVIKLLIISCLHFLFSFILSIVIQNLSSQSKHTGCHAPCHPNPHLKHIYRNRITLHSNSSQSKASFFLLIGTNLRQVLVLYIPANTTRKGEKNSRTEIHIRTKTCNTQQQNRNQQWYSRFSTTQLHRT